MRRRRLELAVRKTSGSCNEAISLHFQQEPRRAFFRSIQRQTQLLDTASPGGQGPAVLITFSHKLTALVQCRTACLHGDKHFRSWMVNSKELHRDIKGSSQHATWFERFLLRLFKNTARIFSHKFMIWSQLDTNELDGTSYSRLHYIFVWSNAA